MFLVLLCCCLAVLCQGVLSEGKLCIKNTNELVDFSKNVSSGTSYNGTTVLLDDDIDFSDLSDEFEPIGKSDIYFFQGTFDGQGHTISNLAMNSSSQHVGLFGNSYGAIRNVVLDSSCSVVSSFIGNANIKVGGIAGHCGYCTIENTVNMASVSFTGNTTGSSGFLYLGGIVGMLYASSKETIARNCANYGSVTHSGTSSRVYIGGVAGVFSAGSSSSKIYIQNSLNYGTINHNGTTSNILRIGGIIGYEWWGTINIENCVSGGKITSNKTSNYIGSIVGYVGSSTTIKHCYWSSDVDCDYAYGGGNPTIDSETSLVSLNTATVNNLNSYNSSWDKWFMLHLNGGNINNLNQEALIVTQKHFPEPAKEGNTFLFWCLDTDCDEKYNPKAIDITKVTELYAVWNISTVLFVFGNGTIATKNLVYGQNYGTLPDASKTGYTFAGWFTEKEEGKGEKVTEDDIMKNIFDHTLYAQWTVNNYTMTFDFGNETVVNKTLSYNETIIYPENNTREGFVFNGWNPKPERMPANDTTAVAQWTANNYTVTLNVNGGDALKTNEFIVAYDKPYNCLPNATRTGHTFLGWYTDKNGGTEITNETTANIIANNHTLYAQWIINNYTLTFDFGNGTVANTTLTYNETIIYPKNPTREGHTFSGWELKPERMPANDTTVIAQWTEIVAEVESEYVEIVFDRKKMTEDEVKEIIKSITQDENFYIERIETDKDTGETIAIIRFTNAEKAKDFVRSVNEGKPINAIKSVRTVPAEQDSFALKINTMSMTILLILYFMCAAPV